MKFNPEVSQEQEVVAVEIIQTSNNPEVVEFAKIPSCPTYFNRESKKFYNKFTTLLIDEKKLKEQDWPAYLNFCNIFGLYEKNMKDLAVSGMISISRDGVEVESIQSRLMFKLQKELAVCYRQFGISPAYATKLKSEKINRTNDGIKHLFANNE